MNNQVGYVLVVYHSLSQSSDDFENFLSGFDQAVTDTSLSNPALRMILGDLKCRSSSWGRAVFLQKKGLI